MPWEGWERFTVAGGELYAPGAGRGITPDQAAALPFLVQELELLRRQQSAPAQYLLDFELEGRHDETDSDADSAPARRGRLRDDRGGMPAPQQAGREIERLLLAAAPGALRVDVERSDQAGIHEGRNAARTTAGAPFRVVPAAPGICRPKLKKRRAFGIPNGMDATTVQAAAGESGGEVGATGRGAGWTVAFAPGAADAEGLLEAALLDPEAAGDSVTGVGDAGIFGEFFHSSLDSFGSQMQVGATTWFVGLAVKM